MFMFSNASEFSCDIINYCDLCMLFRNRTCMAECRRVRVLQITELRKRFKADVGIYAVTRAYG